MINTSDKILHCFYEGVIRAPIDNYKDLRIVRCKWSGRRLGYGFIVLFHAQGPQAAYPCS
jgi:hypothetical protein